MTEIASHRGGALLWAENSRLAFEQTAKLPVEQVEFDVHPSRDGRLVVIHDATLARTTDGAGAVCQHDWSELSKLILKGSGAALRLVQRVARAVGAPKSPPGRSRYRRLGWQRCRRDRQDVRSRRRRLHHRPSRSGA